MSPTGTPNSKTNDILCPKQVRRKFGEKSFFLNGQTNPFCIKKEIV